MSLVLKDVAKFVTSKIDVSEIDETNYISTENMLPNKCGIEIASSLPDTNSVRAYLPNDILINNIRPYFKKIWYSDMEGGCSNDVFVIRSKENYDSKFLYYVLSSDDFFSYVMANATGTKMPRGDKKAIQNYGVPNFSIDEQKRISLVLSKIDEKIEVNNKINKNLEAIANNIFKNYFIDYEPFKNLTFIDTIIGNVPKEWEFTKIEDVIDVRDGTHDSPSAIEVGFPLITSKHLNEYDVNKNEANKISFEDYTNINKRSLVEPFDILISMIGTVGNICYIMYDEVDFAIKNVGLFKTSQTPLLREYLLLYLKSIIIKQYIDSRLAGSTQKYISLTELRNIPIVIPPREILEEFTNVVNPLFNKIKSNHFEMNNLVKLRDTLLPKLMSGEIDVSNVML